MSDHWLIYWDAAAIDEWERAAPGPADPPEAQLAIIGPLFALPAGCVGAIPSWAVETPPGAWVEIQLRAVYGERATRWYRLAAWDSAHEASRRTSFDGQHDDEGRVATDTFLFAASPDSLQARILLCLAPGAGELPALHALALCLLDDQPWTVDAGAATVAQAAPADAPATVPPPPDGRPYLVLPHYRSQYSYAGGAGWCSPTALSMVLAYWYARTADPRLVPFADPGCVPDLIVPMVYDPAYQGTGNWSMNVAYAASLGLIAYVARFQQLVQLAAWPAAGVPLIASLAWQPGELDGAPLEKSNGHLTVVTGVADGLVHVADPAAARAEECVRSYRAAQFYHCWQQNSAGVVYLIHPPGWPQ